MTQDPTSGAVESLAESRLFGKLPADVITRLAAGARPVHFAVGEMLYSQGERPRAQLLIRGLVRLFLVGPEEQQITGLYLRGGDAVPLFSFGATGLTINVQALTPTTALELQPGELTRLAQLSPEFGLELGTELFEQWQLTLGALGLQAFGTVRERVLHHLLEVATWDRRSNRFYTNMSHQQLADAAGTVRDIVGRILRDLRDRETVELQRGRIDIKNVDALREELCERFPRFVTQTRDRLSPPARS